MRSLNSPTMKLEEIDVDAYNGIKYSQEIPYTSEKTRGAVRYTSTIPLDIHMQTTYHSFQHGLQIENGQRSCYGTRKTLPNGGYGAYEWMTYRQVADVSAAFAAGLTKFASLQHQDSVGILSKNCVEWCLTQHACDRQSYISVPVYDTLGPEAVVFILQHADIKVLIVGEGHFSSVIEIKEDCPNLVFMVQVGTVSPHQRDIANSKGLQLKSFDEIIEMGKMRGIAADLPTGSDICSILYTSGTTGNPKGVVLLHQNVASTCAIALDRNILSAKDVHISYLPLPHALERTVMTVLIYLGAAVGFYRGDILTLMDDIAELKPTLFVSVPRLLNRVYDKVMQGVASAGGIKKLLFDQAYASKRAYLTDGYNTHMFWDALVFSKLRMLLGGRVSNMISGSAPLSTEVKEFLKIVFCCNIIEGYGLTETAAFGAMSYVDQPLGPHVGVPSTNTEVRLQDVPEMNYTSMDRPRPRGEVLIRGPTVFAGYHKDPELTAEVLDKDGWFHTGDIGCWNADGSLSIIDRKKNIFKLSQGEYVSPEKIEAVYQKSKYIAQIFVHGDSLQSTLIAIIVPDPEIAEKWALEKGVLLRKGENVVNILVHNPDFEKDVLADMQNLAKAGNLKGFETVKRVYMYPHLFSIENGLITPTFKLRRPQLRQLFEKQIEAMYRDINRTN